METGKPAEIRHFAQMHSWGGEATPKSNQEELFALHTLGPARPRDYPSRRDTRPSLPPLPLDGEQLDALAAIRAFLEGPGAQYFCLQGLAGTGKTTVLAALARELPDACLLSPTGKAATVLGRKTGAQASTLHRVLYTPVEGEGRRVTFAKMHMQGELTGSVALVDEASMIDANLANDLLETGLRVITSSDPGQLPPVHGLQFFTEADFTLQQVRRQAQDSPIIRQAHAVRDGFDYMSDGDAFQVVSKRDGRAVVISADIVLCWKNETRHRMNSFVRAQRGIVATELPRAGEPVICLENGAGMMNGEIFTVASDYQGNGLALDNGLTIQKPWFEWLATDDRWPRGVTPFGLAYAITVHKAQGSEWPRVTVLDEFTGEDRKRWLYTAITRASSEVRVIPRTGN